MAAYQPAERILNTFAGGSVAIDRLNNERRQMAALTAQATASHAIFILFDAELKALGNNDSSQLLLIDSSSSLHGTLAELVQDEARHRCWMFIGKVTGEQQGTTREVLVHVGVRVDSMG
jgi:hypothetical protein